MRKYLVILSLLLLAFPLWSAESVTQSTLDSVWHSFRAIHPYGYQTVAKGHYGDDCLFIVSEPSESVSQKSIGDLFTKYGGTSAVKRIEFGYDGWLSDVVGVIRFKNEAQETAFTKDLFTLLYGTDYKASYTDLDHLSRHVYYSPYELNYSISAADLTAWFIDENEELQDDNGVKKNVKAWLSTSFQESNKLLFSCKNGFVVWLINTRKINAADKLFKTNARRFSLDSDLIIGAFGKKGGNVAVIAREREVPLSVMPPLRIETLTLLATTSNKHLAQSYERYHVFAAKMKGNKDFAPIYLSDELWHTEYGNLLNVTDQMLKSWSENGDINYYAFDYPKPIDWAFSNGAVTSMGSSSLTYNWNTKGAGYVIEDDDFDVYAINRTGSLPVSYFPDEMEGKVEEKVYDAEEMAYDFFSQLNNPELVRVVQYAAFYQILVYFKDGNGTPIAPTKDISVPDYSVFNPYVESLLRFADHPSDTCKLYRDGLAHFKKMYKEANDATGLLKEYLENDPYGEFMTYLEENMEAGELSNLTNGYYDEKNAEQLFKEFVDSNVVIVKQYIEEYRQEYGAFPYSEAARYIVSPREIEIQHSIIQAKNANITKEYDSFVKKYFTVLEELDRDSKYLYSQTPSGKLSAIKYDTIKRLRPLKSILDNNSSQEDNDFKDEYFVLPRFESADEREAEDDRDIQERVYARLEELQGSSFIKFVYGNELNRLINKWNKNEKLGEQLVDMQASLSKKLEPNNKYLKRLSYLQVDGNQQKAVGALNWLLTDATPYEEPSGDFFVSKLSGHRQWTKTPNMVCSFGSSGYGGHNLDAHVTPVKTSTSVPKGKCRVTIQDGNRVISVAKADRKSITPEVLRKVERQVAGNNELISLPPAPPTKPQKVLVTELKRTERGYCPLLHDGSQNVKHSVKVGDSEVTKIGDLIESRASNAVTEQNASNQIRIKRYTEREVLVEVDGQQYVLERSEANSINLQDMSKYVKEETRGDRSAVILSQKPETIEGAYKAASFEITCPQENSNALKKAVNNIMDNPSLDVDNLFKLKWNIEKQMRLEAPNFNSKDIQFEKVIFSYLIIDQYYRSDGQNYPTVEAA